MENKKKLPRTKNSDAVFSGKLNNVSEGNECPYDRHLAGSLEIQPEPFQGSPHTNEDWTKRWGENFKKD